MGYHKGHKEFHVLDMDEGWHSLPGYPAGIQEKIIAGELDEKNKRGNRTRLMRFAPGTYTTDPFVHDYWEEVFLLSGDLIVGNDRQGNGGREIPELYLCGASTWRLSRALQIRLRLPAPGNSLLRRNLMICCGTTGPLRC